MTKEEVTPEQFQAWQRLSESIAAAKEKLNALCAEAHQVGLRTEMTVHSYEGQCIGDTVHRQYTVLTVDVSLSLTHAPYRQ